MEKRFAIKLFALGLVATILLSGVALTASAEFAGKRAAGLIPDPIMPAECYHPELPKDEWGRRDELAGACRDFWKVQVERLLNEGVSPERTWIHKPELELAICSKRLESIALVELLVRKGANVKSLGGTLGDKTLFQLTLEGYLPFEQKKSKILALIDGGIPIDLNALQKAKESGVFRIEIFERELADFVAGREKYYMRDREMLGRYGVPGAVRKGMCRIEDAQKFGVDPIMSRAEWDQLEQVIKDAKERREKLCGVVAEFLPVSELAALVCGYERGPAGEYDDMPPLEDVPAEELEGENLES